MTAEEKYQEIVNSRKAAEDSKPEETKPQETSPSSVGADLPADEKKPETEKKPEDKADGKGEQKPTKSEQEEHAFAAMRFKHKRENDELKARIAELEKQIAANQPKPAAKTRKDFDKDEDYEKFVRESLADEVREKVLAEVNAQNEVNAKRDKFTAKLRGDLEAAFSKDIADKVFKDMADPESEMTMIVTDKAAEPMMNAIKSSKRMVDMLALMQAKPQIFRSLIDLPPERQAYRIFQLEDQIEAKYAQIRTKQQSEQQKKEKADSVPTPGPFGNGEQTNKGLSGMSDAARVNRIKEEIRKKRAQR